MNENEKPVTKEMIMAALANKEVIIQQSKPARRIESNIDKVNRQVNRVLAAYYYKERHNARIQAIANLFKW